MGSIMANIMVNTSKKKEMQRMKLIFQVYERQ